MAEINFTAGQIFVLSPYFSALEGTPLKFSLKRKLIRFNERLSAEYKLIREELDKVVKEYCKKDEEGNPIIENDKYIFDDEKIEEVNKKMFEIENSVINFEYEDFKLPEEAFDNLSCTKEIVKIIEDNFLEV